MQRERRYIIFKTTDAVYLSAEGKKAVADLIEAMTQIREDHGKPPLNCVVIEEDWPEYEKVWKMLEARVNLTAFANDPAMPQDLSIKIQEFIKEHAGKY